MRNKCKHYHKEIKKLPCLKCYLNKYLAITVDLSIFNLLLNQP